MKTTKP